MSSRFRLSSWLLMVMILLALASTPFVYAGTQVAGTGRYSCGVDNPSGDQCQRTVAPNPIDCVTVIDPKTGVASKVCKERPRKHMLLAEADMQVRLIDAQHQLDEQMLTQ